jgi:hypothetical protein
MEEERKIYMLDFAVTLLDSIIDFGGCCKKIYRDSKDSGVAKVN